jgi:phenylalanyl-tRNA synthetase beta chain
MKFTLSWLKDHLETAASLEQISEKLTSLGLEVEDIADNGAALRPFIVGEITAAEQHPNADRLRVCTVDTGSSTLQIVCGAPNARAGIKVALSRPGDVIPVTGQALKAGVIRNVESQGMMLSEREMNLPETIDGIIELPIDAPVGGSVVEALGLGDPIIEINLTPNRADCAGVRGIARDLAASGLGNLKPVPFEPVPGAFASPLTIAIAEEARRDCPWFMGRVIRGVKNGPSPAWLQERLRAIGLRSISALVDITNYFTFDLGRPLHVFDAAKVSGGLTIRHASEGESIEALNGKTYPLKPDYLVIADDNHVESIAGVMGGIASGCSADTTEVFLEVAYFRPGTVAATGRDLQLPSDARYRFERGVDPAFLPAATELATRMIIELCGGEASEILSAGAEPIWQRRLTLRQERCATLGGVDLPLPRQIQLLEAIGCRFENTDIIPPSWRADIEGEADLVEEVLRLNGFDQIPALPLPRMVTITKPAVTPTQKRTMLAKRSLAARGLHEAVTFSFMSSTVAKAFAAQPAALHLLNPISSDLDVMRGSILPNLLQAAARNADRGQKNAALFEIGPIYGEMGQQIVAALVRTGETGLDWAAPAKPVSVFDAKADVLGLLASLGAPVDSLVLGKAPAWYHPGRSGSLSLGNRIIAQFGEVHPTVLAALSSPQTAVGAEIFLDNLPEPKRKGTEKPLLQLAAFQPVERDFAFVVQAETPADSVLKAVRGADKRLIAGVALFDVYQGQGIEPEQKSLAVRVTLQPTEQTLTDEEIEAVSQRIIAAVGEATGGMLRG